MITLAKVWQEKGPLSIVNNVGVYETQNSLTSGELNQLEPITKSAKSFQHRFLLTEFCPQKCDHTYIAHKA